MDTANATRGATASTTATATAATAAIGGKLRTVGTSSWIAILMFLVGLGFLIGNIVLMTQLAGSSDAWDSIKTQMGGAATMAFIGALGFMVSLLLYFSSFNVDMPIYILTVMTSLAIAISLTALSVAAITR